MSENNKVYSQIKKNTVTSKNQLNDSKLVRFMNLRGKGKRIMFVGNSITLHGILPSIGWHNEWGMAASKQENDYVHILMAKINEIASDSQYCICQVAEWERQYINGESQHYLFESARDFEADVIEKIRRARLNGFTHYMIVVAEGAGSAAEISAKIKELIDLDPRVTVLGHIQSGGCPTGRDRVNATKMGYLAVKNLYEGKTNRIICTQNGSFIDVDIQEGLKMHRDIQSLEVDLLTTMTGI